MLKLDTRYVRRSVSGDESIVKINNEEELKYHTDLAEKGFVYKEVIIHPMKEECESCSA